jgi:hypothetical protein
LWPGTFVALWLRVRIKYLSYKGLHRLKIGAGKQDLKKYRVQRPEDEGRRQPVGCARHTIFRSCDRAKRERPPRPPAGGEEFPHTKAQRSQRRALRGNSLLEQRMTRMTQRGLRPQPKNFSHKGTKITKKSAPEAASYLRGFVASCEYQVFVP